MADLGTLLGQAYEARVAAAEIEMTPEAIRAVVATLGGGESRAQIAVGTRQLAAQVDASVRTVQRWMKAPGTGEARSAARTTVGRQITIKGVANAQQRQVNAQALRTQVQTQGLDVGGCRVMVLVYNEDHARGRNVPEQHLDGDALTEALDALEEGDLEAAAAAFGDAWLEAYGMDVDASVTDVVGAFDIGL